MTIKVEQVTGWKRVLNAARFTVRKGEVDKEPSINFKRMILKAEHSPIRLLEFDVKIFDIPYWVKVHFIRHHIGTEKFVSTQRDDRIEHEISRGKMPQDTPVNMWLTINAQALINISRVRLCNKASKETREVWKEVCNQVMKIEPAFVGVLVPNCIYRKQCPEPQTCGMFKELIHDKKI